MIRRITAGPDGNLWIRDTVPGVGIQRMTTNGVRYAPVATGMFVNDIAVGPDGAVYWSEFTVTTGQPISGGIERLAPSGVRTPFLQSEISTSALAIDPNNPNAVVYGATDHSPGGGQNFCRVTFGQVVGGFCLPLGIAGATPESVAYAADGRPWFAYPAFNRLIQPAPGDDSNIAASIDYPASTQPRSLVLGPDGNLWATLSTAGAIERISPFGRTRFDLGAGHEPREITVGPDGALWFTDNTANAIGRITTDGQVRWFPVPTAGALPDGITTGRDGAIWFTESGTSMVGRLTLDPPQAGGPGGSGVADRAAPVFTRALSVSRSRFRATAAAMRRPTPRGTAFRFSLTEPARVTITIAKPSTGRRIGGRCVKPTRSNRRRSRCTRYATAGTLRRDGRQGANEIAFGGRLNGRRLSGTYRGTALATDPSGNASKPSRVTFTVVSR